MTTLVPLQRPACLRRLFGGDRLLVALVFVTCVFTVPRLLSLLTTAHFVAQESASIYVAVQNGGNGFDLVGMKAPVTLQTRAFVADGDKPSAPNSTEAADRVRILRRDDASTLMETVWSNDDYAITSRYRVAGEQVSPVSRQTFGVPHVLMGLPIAAVVALASKVALARRRSYRALQGA